MGAARLDQRAQGREVAVDRRRANAGALGDVSIGSRRHPLLQMERQRRPHDLLAGLLLGLGAFRLAVRADHRRFLLTREIFREIVLSSI
jgi:hypothetical protein